MKVAVYGGRQCTKSQVFSVLDVIDQNEPITSVIFGHKKGAEKFAGQWAVERSKIRHLMKADWNRFGDTAEDHRDHRVTTVLHADIDLIVVFPGKVSSVAMTSEKSRFVSTNLQEREINERSYDDIFGSKDENRA